ncbi:MAG TPA: glycosyltransferase [Acidobacteriota bacterium]
MSHREPRHILVVTEMYPPEVEGIAFTTWKFCRALVGRGLKITLITAAHSAGPEPWWSDPGIREIRLAQLPQHLPRRLAGNLGRLYLGTYWGSWWAAAASRVADRLIRGGEVDCVITRTEPRSGIVVGQQLARRHKITWLAAVNDPHPACLYPPPYAHGQPSSLRERSQCRWTAAALDRASAVVVPSQRLEQLQRQHGIFSNELKTFVIPHCGLVPDIDQTPSATRRDRIELVHIGMIDARRRNLARWIDTLNYLLQKSPRLAEKLTIRFIGGGVDEPSKKQVAQSGLGHYFSFESQILPQQCMQAIGRADAVLLIEAPLREGVFLLAKLSDYIVSGRPTLMLSPINGMTSDWVGGLQHPGFLTQDPAVAAERLAAFLQRRIDGQSCADYAVPSRRGVHPTEHADMWLEAIRSCAV